MTEKKGSEPRLQKMLRASSILIMRQVAPARGGFAHQDVGGSQQQVVSSDHVEFVWGDAIGMSHTRFGKLSVNAEVSSGLVGVLRMSSLD